MANNKNAERKDLAAVEETVGAEEKSDLDEQTKPTPTTIGKYKRGKYTSENKLSLKQEKKMIFAEQEEAGNNCKGCKGDADKDHRFCKKRENEIKKGKWRRC